MLVPNINGKAHGWIPWHYEKERRIKKMVNVVGGKKISNAAITSWSAELFFPYGLFNPLGNIPPASGTIWNANFYRLDYDTGKMIKGHGGRFKNLFMNWTNSALSNLNSEAPGPEGSSFENLNYAGKYFPRCSIRQFAESRVVYEKNSCSVGTFRG